MALNENPPEEQDTPENLTERLAQGLDSINKSEGWSTIRNWWDNLSNEDRTKLYESGEPGILNTIFKGSLPINVAKSMAKYDNGFLKFSGENFAMGFRGLIHLGMLSAPTGVSIETLADDAKSDIKSYKRLLFLVKALCVVFAPEAVLEVDKISDICVKLAELKTEVSLASLNGRITATNATSDGSAEFDLAA